MAWTASVKGSGADYVLVPPGTHIALCNLVVDLGLQPAAPNSKFPKDQYQMYIGFELPNEIMEYTNKEGNLVKGPMVIGKFFTVSMHEKANLRKALESWRGRTFTDEEAGKFDIGSIIGKGCQINVLHDKKADGTIRANINAILSWPKGMAVPGFTTKPLYYAPDDRTMYDELPEWLRKKVDAQIKTGTGELAQGEPQPIQQKETFDEDSVPF